MRSIFNNSQRRRNSSKKENLTNSYNEAVLRNTRYKNNSMRSTHYLNNNKPLYNHSSHNSRVISINDSKLNNNIDDISNTKSYLSTDKFRKKLINSTVINNRYNSYNSNLLSKDDNNYNSFANKRENTETNINNNNTTNSININNNNTTNRRNNNYFVRIITNPKLKTKEKTEIEYKDTQKNSLKNNNNNNSNNNNNKRIMLSKIPINNKNKPIKILPRYKTNYPINTLNRSQNTIILSNENSINFINNKQNKELSLYNKRNEINKNKDKDDKNNNLHNLNDNNNNRYKEIAPNEDNNNTNINTNNINTKNKVDNNLKESIDVTVEKQLKKEEILFDVTNKEIGIMNLGNTCFINSCLQVLIHCPLFMYNLTKNLKLINKDTPITSNFLSICDLMTSTEENSIDISDFKNLLGIKHKIFEGYLQNDSQEFCRILLEDISSELNEIKAQSLYRILSNSNKKSKKNRDKDFHTNFSQREKSIITDLFYAQIVNTFTCECKNEIYSFEKILDFPLLFPEKINNNKIKIHELLKLHFKMEYIDFEINCSNCQKKSKHKKEIKISRPPEILILSLQRIDQKTQNKLDYIVEYPKYLSLYEFTDHECGFDKECSYSLFAVINHSGNINSGHYYSFIKLGKIDWFLFNDSEVKNIKTIDDFSENVYALFYVKLKYNNMKFKSLIKNI